MSIRHAEVGPLLVDCGCTVTVYRDGSGIEMHYCDTHESAPALAKALEDAILGLESIVRNILEIRRALRHAGLPDSWLEGIPPKLDRARLALAAARLEGKP